MNLPANPSFKDMYGIASRIARENTTINAIYSSHATSSDALEILEHIPERSLVFVESMGHALEGEPANGRFLDFSGVDQESVPVYTQDELDKFDSLAVPMHYYGFAAALSSGLIARRCIKSVVDIPDLDLSETPSLRQGRIAELFSRYGIDSTSGSVAAALVGLKPRLTAELVFGNESRGRRFRDLMVAEAQWIRFQRFRDEMAAMGVDRMLAMPMILRGDFVPDNDAYLVYGAYHRPITKRLRDLGYQVREIVLRDLPQEYSVIAESLARLRVAAREAIEISLKIADEVQDREEIEHFTRLAGLLEHLEPNRLFDVIEQGY